MKKTFILDTNVLLNDPNSLYTFEENDVIIPIYVLEEVDTFKKDMSELGKNARAISRILDGLRAHGRLVDGVSVNDEGGTLRVAFATKELPKEFALLGNTADSRILAVANQMQKESPDTPCIFVTKDINLRVRGAALGLQVMDYMADKVHMDDLYSGRFERTVDDELMQQLFANGEAQVPVESDQDEKMPPNSFAVLHGATGGGSAIVRIQSDGTTARVLKGNGPSVWGIRPRNKEQHFAFELLLDDNVRLVTLVGQAGTGKTLLALAAGLQKAAEEQVYQRLLVSRPVFPLGKDIGFLPGDVNEKLRPWMQPVHDNLELLLGISSREKRTGRSSDELFDMDMVHIEPLTYIRGRSIPSQFILVDEAQNLTPHEVKTIITRAGDDTKIVLTGDPYQIDNPYVDATNNGLVHVVKRFKGEAIAGHITLVKGERSDLAERAAELL
ncbi:MAG: PhoH family protein [Deltaproteobacteria bacterium]|nr:PhoH family protein [Deltaproteobacteria bacterium]MBN2673113.1 PhoH family protein [Deltaproteobacteria bacterium]